MEERAKRPGTLARCLSFAGARRGLVVASLLLAALSAAASFIPFVAIYFVIADVVAAYPNLAALDAGALAGCGLLAVAGVAADVGLYLAALLCSHAAAFDTQYRLKLGIAEHLGRIPLGHIARLGSGRLSKIMDEGVGGIETFIAHSLPDLASTAAAPAVLLVLCSCSTGASGWPPSSPSSWRWRRSSPDMRTSASCGRWAATKRRRSAWATPPWSTCAAWRW